MKSWTCLIGKLTAGGHLNCFKKKTFILLLKQGSGAYSGGREASAPPPECLKFFKANMFQLFTLTVCRLVGTEAKSTITYYQSTT